MTVLNFEKCINLKAPLLITGETGVGKSHLAREIYQRSRIHKEKFLTAHLASLKEDLLESELFGHKKGAFTGALEHKNGYLSDVGAGTLFLDEIGELSLEAQKKLLYLLEEKRFTPIGATGSVEFQGRIIMATNRSLEKMVRTGLFREDLYYRIKVFHFEIPPLRDNKQHMREVIEAILNQLKSSYHGPYVHLSPNAYAYLEQKEWRGNIRELKNALEFAVALASRNRIEVSDFPEEVNEPQEKTPWSAFADFPEDYREGQELFEKLFLETMLNRNGGRVNETAKRLGLSKTTLIHKAKKYGINTLKMRAEAA